MTGEAAQQSSGPRWLPSLLAEAVVVILSILIAFGLDAGWDAHRERQELNLDLASILEEVATSRIAVSERIESYEKIVSGTEALLAAMESSQESSMVTIPDTIAYLAGLLPTLNPRMSVLESFIASGRLAVVSDRQLRQKLAGLPGKIEDAVKPIERQRDVFFSVHQVELGRDFDIAPVIRFVRLPNFGSRSALPSLGDVAYPNRIPVRNHTRSRLAGVQGTLAGLRALVEDLRAIEALIADRVRS